MNTASGIALNPSESKPDSRRRKLLIDSFSMSIVGQLERLVGIVVTRLVIVRLVIIKCRRLAVGVPAGGRLGLLLRRWRRGI